MEAEDYPPLPGRHLQARQQVGLLLECRETVNVVENLQIEESHECQAGKKLDKKVPAGKPRSAGCAAAA